MKFSANQTTDLYALMEDLPRNSPSWNLVDAFDAVTNGIENPEALAGLDLITEGTLQPWKTLIRAIQALYAYDIPRCRREAEAMDDNSPPGVLKPFFRAWLARQGTNHRETIFKELIGACDSVAGLYRRLLIEPHPLAVLAEQAEEALRQGLYAQFEGFASEILRKLQEEKRCDGPLLALRYALYCLKLLDAAGYGGADFFSAVLKSLGEADGSCALGLALVGRNNKAAASALRRAVEAGDGVFLDPAMMSLLGELLPLLEGQSPASSRPRGRIKTSPQLELFGDLDG
jgi:hypothetical protein